MEAAQARPEVASYGFAVVPVATGSVRVAMYRLHRVMEPPPEVCPSHLVSVQLVRADLCVSVLACPVQARAVM